MIDRNKQKRSPESRRRESSRKHLSSRSRSRSQSYSPSLNRKNRDNKYKKDDQSKGRTRRIDYDSYDSGNVKEKFVWGKKMEELKSKGVNPSELERLEKEKEAKLALEVEKVRKRRQENDRDQRADQKKGQQDKIEEETYEEWLQKEEKFHIEQAKIRSEIRIQEGREQPVDNLIKILLLHRGKFEYDPIMEREVRKPYILLTRLTPEELTKLQQDIQEQARIEVNDFYVQFWDQMLLLVEDRIATLNNYTFGKKGRGSMGEEFEAEVNEMIGDKNYNELIELEKEIHQTLDCPSEFKIDVEYWENILKKLKIRKAKAYLEDMGSKFLESYNKANPNPTKKKSAISVVVNTGDMSPRLLDCSKGLEKLSISAAEDIEALNEERGNILMRELQKYYAQNPVKTKSKKEVENGMEEEEGETEEFNGVKEENEFDDIAIEGEHIYEWADKYKPRKPQYFNRVKVGYEWNKYNQTHYDQDNPPPKVVQGYKFNIFYPDLVDHTKAPEFHLEATENPDFCIIRFQAGAPYEDVAFKIWNREWDFADRQGFKCIYEGGILYLYFNFRKPRYRR